MEVCFPEFSLCWVLSPPTLCLWDGSGHTGPRVGSYAPFPQGQGLQGQVLLKRERCLFAESLPIVGLCSRRLSDYFMLWAVIQYFFIYC